MSKYRAKDYKLVHEYGMPDLKQEMENMLQLPVKDWNVVTTYELLEDGLVTRTLTVTAYEVNRE